MEGVVVSSPFVPVFLKVTVGVALIALLVVDVADALELALVLEVAGVALEATLLLAA